MTDEIYQKYAADVNRFLLALTHDSDLAEELTQETFYQAVRSIEGFEGRSSLYSWLCGIAKRCLGTYLSKRPKEADIIVQPSAAVSESAEEKAIANIDRVDLLKSLHKVPEPQREIIYLHIFCGLSFKEIGEIFEMTDNWARVNYYRGKNKLKREVNKDE